MTRNCSPQLHSPNVIKHDPCVLEVTTRLHTGYQVHATSGANLGHFEHKYFVRVGSLTKELFSCTKAQLLQPRSFVMLSMTPKRRKYLNVLTSFRILGELMNLHFSRTGINSWRPNRVGVAPSGRSSISPRNSLLASKTIAEFVPDGFRSTWSNIKDEVSYQLFCCGQTRFMLWMCGVGFKRRRSLMESTNTVFL